MKAADRPSRTLRLVLTALPLLALATASLGAWTRLADAGLGCPDWPGCYGFALLPQGEAEISLAEQRYPDTPYEADKALLEVAHRYVAALTGLLILIALGLVATGRQPGTLTAPQHRSLLRLTGLSAVLVVIQGLFGYLTVSLKLWPQVVSAHLFGGMLVLCLVWWIWLDKVAALPRPQLPLGAVLAALAALLLQMALGVWVSSNYAAMACPDFPLCQGQWWPPTDFAAGFSLANPPGPNYLHGQLESQARTAIQIAHRLGALIAAAALVYLAVLTIGRGYLRRGALLLALLAAQLALGIANVVLVLPLPVAVGHHLGAALLLMTLVSMLPGRPTPPQQA